MTCLMSKPSQEEKENREKEAGLNNEEPATEVIWPAVCALWCHVSAAGLQG